MPYGLPGLTERETGTITRWLEARAPYEGPPPLPADLAQQVRAWEAFLNGDSPKERLMSPYLYEHLFLGHLHFESDPAHRAFRLVRSATAPGRPVVPIATRRPFDDPGVPRPFHRLEPEREAIVAKTHMPCALSPERMRQLRGWFVSAPYEVRSLPSYAAETAANPFVAFEAIPLESRYRFLLDEAQFFVMNFIKGPVCRGQLALDVIEDRFWVVFMDPKASAGEASAELLARQSGNLRLPAELGSDAPILRTWRQYADLETRYLQAKTAFLSQALGKPDLSLIWNGDGRNRNAALTVFRHFDSASVEQGFVGEPTRDHWYRGAPDDVEEYVYGRKAAFDRETGIVYRTSDPQRELYGMLRARLAPVLETRFDLSTLADARLRHDLESLAAVRGASLAWLPETVFLQVDDAPEAGRYFTLLRDTGHRNVSHVFLDKGELLPAENALTVVPGFVGAYPNAVYRVTRAELPALTAAIGSLASEDDYRKLADRFAIRRTNPAFWAASDALVGAYARQAPREAGLFDYNRLENR